jgi:DNA-binding NtrC family response regulator
VQERKREAPPQRLLTWDYFELRLEEAIRRGRRLDRSFVVLQIQADWRHAAAVERRMVALLPQLDAVARDVPGEFSVLMVDADELDGEAAARWLATALEDPRVQVAVGQAVYPADGSTVDELTTCAARRAAGAEEETRDVDEPVSVDPATKRLFRLVERVAAVPLHVLVVGDAGVGKSLVAGELHRRSGRAPVLTLDGGADDLFEVLFGDEGRLERARGGVLVIDKLCAMPLDAQARLATWLETAEREGGTDTAVRVIAMESRDVDAAVDAAELHRELHALLTNVVVEVPPLRRRPADIEPLARRFVSEAAAAGERPEPELTLDAIDLLRGHVWPGNVRELRGVMRRAVALSDGMVITPRELPVEKLTAAFVADSTAELPAPQLFDEVRRERESIERQRIVDTLEQADGNQTKAAKLLGISRRTLINRLEAYGLPRPRKRR